MQRAVSDAPGSSRSWPLVALDEPPSRESAKRATGLLFAREEEALPSPALQPAPVTKSRSPDMNARTVTPDALREGGARCLRHRCARLVERLSLIGITVVARHAVV